MESAQGKGSRFELSVPVRTVPDLPLRETNALPEDVEADTDERPLAVLVAEDNSVNAMVISAMLKRMNCQVLVAADGEKALQAYDGDRYGLVLLDLHMPVLGGMQVLAGILARQAVAGDAGPPVVALTADAYQETREACAAAGFSDFLTKPVSKAEVSRIVADARARPAP